MPTVKPKASEELGEDLDFDAKILDGVWDNLDKLKAIHLIRKSFGFYGDRWLKAHGLSESRMLPDLRRFFEKQTRAILKGVELLEGNWTPEAVFDADEWDGELLKVVELHLARAGFLGASMGYIQFKKDAVDNILITLPDSVQKIIRQTLADTLKEPYWKDINLTTAWKLKRAFERSREQGYNLRQQVQEIKKSLGPKANADRALTIARTENTGMMNAGAYAVQQELADEGLIGGVSWLAMKDEDTREAHVIANGQEIGVDGLFELINPKTGLREYAPYPGYHKLSAAQRVHCRCTSISLRPTGE